MSRANTSSVEMDDGIKMAHIARSKRDTFGTTVEPNQTQEAGKRKEADAKQKAKAKARAKLAKKSKRKNK
ncbi:MAG: hypothetical protein MUP09_09165 [Thiovulaceae bacterium]|nr:hypothetical protein [Sulfurimonadaceae bacterium]